MAQATLLLPPQDRVSRQAMAEAAVLADELAQIEMIYGDECVATVRRALRERPENWRVIVEDTVLQWAHDHPRFHLNEF